MQDSTTRRQGRYWFGTLPWTDQEKAENDNGNAPSPPFSITDLCCYIKGQGELGAGGLHHWQLIVVCSRKTSRRSLQQSLCCGGHWELSRSAAAEAYIWKEETRIEGTQFELGRKPLKRNSKEDWESIWNLATNGQFMDIPANIRVINFFIIDLSL